MGFGLLLCGYFVLTFMSFATGEYAFAAYIIGGAVCYFATARLYEYKHRFLLPLITSIAYIVMGVWYGLRFFDRNVFLWSLPLFSNAVNAVMQEVLFAIELCHILGILWAVYELAGKVGVERIKAGVQRNLAFVIAAAVGELAMHIFLPGLSFDTETASQDVRAVIGILILLQLVTYLMNAWLLFRCYQLICPVGEENGRPDKPSRFKFVNDINRKLDEKAERAMRENMEYQKEKARKRETRRKGGKKHR